MKRAVLDIGNTRIKAAVFNDDGSIANQSYFTELETAIHWLQQEQVTSLMTASVAQAIMPHIPGIATYSLTHESRLPFKNHYGSKETLGVDRIAVMAAAAVDYPGKPVLVFDIGTCMTIDLLYPDGSYKGGNISPGINMRLEAMHTMTQRLPLATKEESSSLMGNSTRSAIASGVIHGMRFEIEGYINTYKQEYPELITVLCGGDYSHFEIPHKNEIFAAPGFVLQGLYYLLKLNEN
jgi:type III pantothenate kinase